MYSMKQLEFKIKSILNKRVLNYSDSKYIQKLITMYHENVETDEQIDKFNLFCAKLLFKLNDIERAKDYLVNVEGDKYFSKYYLYFKIYLREKNYLLAYKNLKLYEKAFNEKNNFKTNLTIYEYLFSVIDRENYGNVCIENNGYLNTNKLDNNLNALYNIFIEYLLKGKYDKLLPVLNQMQDYVEKYNISLDFYEIRLLISEIIFVKGEKNEKIDVNELLKESFNLASNFRFSESLEKLQEVRGHLNYNSVSYDYRLIKRYINERLRVIDIYTSDSAVKYEEIKRFARLNSYYGDNYIACQYCLYGIYEFDLPEFDYKVGQYYFSIGEQSKATTYFLNYIRKGGFEYLSQAYYYLSECNSVFNTKKRQKFKIKSYKVKIFITSLTDKTIEDENELYVEKYNPNEIKDIISDFALISTDKKIDVISFLYENGYIKLAETLYGEFYDDISGDSYSQFERKK